MKRSPAPLLCLYSMTLALSCAIGYVPEYHLTASAIRAPLPDHGFYSLKEEETPLRKTVARIEDDLAVFEWHITDSGIHARITNKTRGALVVLWDRAEYVDPEGGSHELVPLYTISGNPSHSIKPGNRRIYAVVPADYEKRAMFDGPIPGRMVDRPEEIQDLYKSHVGKSFQIHLPVRTTALVHEYEFRFTVSNVGAHLARDLF